MKRPAPEAVGWSAVLGLLLTVGASGCPSTTDYFGCNGESGTEDLPEDDPCFGKGGCEQVPVDGGEGEGEGEGEREMRFCGCCNG